MGGIYISIRVHLDISLGPAPRLPQDVHEPRFWRTNRRLGLVLPRYQGRRRDHDALDGVGTQPEADAAVVQQVELEVAAPPQKLPLALRLRHGVAAPPRDDRRPRGDHRLEHPSRQSVRVRGRVVVPEDAPHSAVLLSQGQVEVPVARFLHLLISPLADVAPVRVEPSNIVLHDVAGRQVAAAPVPRLPRFIVFVKHHETSRVAPESGHVRALRVQHQRQRRGLEAVARLDVFAAPAAHGLGPRLRERPLYVRRGDAALLHEGAVRDDSRESVAAVAAGPRVLAEGRCPVQRLDGVAHDLLLLG